MDPFVRRLVERLLDERQPLSRNRHFHTFENPEGRKALKLSRRLRALQEDIVGCATAGGQLRVERVEGGSRVQVHFEQPRSSRVASLESAEFELLLTLPGVRGALPLG